MTASPLSLNTLPDVLLIRIVAHLRLKDISLLMTAFRSPAWTSDRLWMEVLQQYHQRPLPHSYDGTASKLLLYPPGALPGMPPQLALFLNLFTNGDEPPPIRMFIITLRGSTGLLDLYLRARPETRSDKIACSACLVLAERLRKRDTVDFLRCQTGASRDLGDRLRAEAEQFWKVDRGRYLPTTAMVWHPMEQRETIVGEIRGIEKLGFLCCSKCRTFASLMLCFGSSQAREELHEARQDWRVLQRRQKAARDKAKRRARDEKWGITEASWGSSGTGSWEESLLQDLKSRSYSLSAAAAAADGNAGRLSVRSQRAWKAMKTRAVLAEEETETWKLVLKLYAYLDSVSSRRK